MSNNKRQNTRESISKKQTIFDNNADFLYALNCERLQRQFQQIDALDSKTISLLGFSCTLIAILAAALVIIQVTFFELIWSYILLGISIFAFIIIAITSIRSYFTKAWHAGPDIEEAWKYSKTFEKTKMFRWAAESFREAYAINKKPIQTKTSTNRLISVFLIVQIVCQVAAISLIYVY